MDPNQSSSEASSERPTKKARGRPRKSAEGSASEEEKRARGREIQRAFQQRRQAEVTQLQQRVAALESTVEGMSNEFLGFGDRIAKDANAVGDQRVLNDIRRTTQRFLDLAKASESQNETSVNMQSISPVAWSSGLEIPAPMASPFQFNALFATGIPNFDILTSGPNFGSSIDFFPPATGGGRFSPRLNYGLLSNSWEQSPPAPWDNPWLSYLIAGPNSFASRLYVDTIELLVKSLTGEANVPEFIPSSLRYRFRHQNPDSLMRTLSRQLLRMNLSGHNGSSNVETPQERSARGMNPKSQKESVSSGTISTALTPNSRDAVFVSESGLIIQGQDMVTVPGSDEVVSEGQREEAVVMVKPTHYAQINQALSNLLVEIIRDISMEGGSPGDWLDPWSVQQHIGQQWGLRLSSRNIRPTSKTLRMLRGDSSVREVEVTNSGTAQPQVPMVKDQSGSQWSSLPASTDSSDDFTPVLPPRSTEQHFPSLPFTNPDPYFSQRYTYATNVAPPAPPSHFIEGLPAIPSLLLGNPATKRSAEASTNSASSSSRTLPSRSIEPFYGSSTAISSDFNSSSYSSSSGNLPSTTKTFSPPVQDNQRTAILPEILPAAPLVTALMLRAICFGEGPRFQKPAVDETVRSFLQAHSLLRMETGINLMSTVATSSA